MSNAQPVLDLPAQGAATVPDQQPPALPSAVAVVTPMTMIDRALASNHAPETLERLFALQERWEKNQGRKAFDAAVSMAKAAIPAIVKNKAGHNNKRYADFAAIATTVDPILANHGLSYRFRTSQANGQISVTCVLSHRDGHSEETTLAGPADASGSKNAIQAIGSTLSYLQRYSLVQMLGLASTEDDDGKAASGVALLTEKQADDIRDALEANSKPLAKLLTWQKVERIEDIPAANFEACINAIKAPAAK